jgi:hypothetical protein
VGHVRDGPGEGNCHLHGPLGAVEAGAEEFHLDDAQAIVLLGHQLLRMQAYEGGVVLVNALHGHAVGRRPGCVGNGRAPGDVGFVENAGPIYGADHDRLTRAEQDEADRFELVVAIDHRLNPAAAERMADGGCHVETEWGD